MSNSKPLSIFAGIVAAVLLLLLAFILFKDYSSIEIPMEASTAVTLFVSLLSVILFASFCQLFSADAIVRSAGFTLFLSFVLEFFTAGLTGLPSAKSNYFIIALLAIAPIASFILLVIGLFRIASIDGESKRFRTASKCFAIAKLVYLAIIVGGSVLVAMSAMSTSEAKNYQKILLGLKTVFGDVIPSITACWFYWELSRWITLRWNLHKEDYS